MTLRARFFIWITSLLSLTVLGVGGLMVVSERRMLELETANRHHQLIASLKQVCEDSLYKNDDLALYNYLKTLGGERAFLWASFVDADSRSRVHSDVKRSGLPFSLPPGVHAQRFKDLSIYRYQDTGEDVLGYSLPVIYASESVGDAYLFFSEGQLDGFLRQSTMNALKRIGVVSSIMLALGLLGAYWLARAMATPIREIIHGMEQMAKGRFESIPFQKRSDELGRIGNQMSVTIGRLRELDEMKRDFVASVTHELRSPLAAIDSLLRVLLEEEKIVSPEERREFLLTTQNNTTRLARLVDDLLATAKIDANKMECRPEKIDIKALVNDVCGLYEPTARQRGIPLKLEIPQNEVWVQADPDKTTQVLSNLISNAFKFTERGTIKVTVKPNGQTCEIEVADTGMGISAGDRERLFEKFYRANSASGKVKGTGLGLYISKAFMEMQKGRIHAADNPGGGMIFSITLPNDEAA